MCTALDHLHAVTGALYYAHPTPLLYPQAFWVPLLFAAASLFTVAASAPVLRRLGADAAPPPTAREVAADAIGFITAYAYTSWGQSSPTVCLLVLGGFFIARALPRRRWIVPYALLVAVGGTLFEAALSSTGAFHYRAPDLLGVPRWLPGIYLHVALLAAPLTALMRPPRPTAT